MKLPQLHLRDLFWLVLVFALACGWYLSERHREHQIQSAQRLLQEMGAEVFRMHLELNELRGVVPLSDSPSPPPEQPWLGETDSPFTSPLFWGLILVNGAMAWRIVSLSLGRTQRP